MHRQVLQTLFDRYFWLDGSGRPRLGLSRWSWYIIRQISIGIAIVTPFIVLLFLVASLPDIQALSQSGIDLVIDLIYKVQLRTILIIDRYFPFIVVLGTTLGLGRLIDHNEINAARFLGIDIKRITAIIASFALLLALTQASFKEWVATDAQSALRTKLGQQTFISPAGDYQWLRNAGNLVGFQPTEAQVDYFQDIIHLQFADGNLTQVLTATDAQYFPNNPDQKKWYLTEVVIDDYPSLTSQNLDELWLDTSFVPLGGNWLGFQADELRFANLVQFKCLDLVSLDTQDYCTEFWRRITYPLLTVSLMLFVSTFIYGLSRYFPTSVRLLIAIVISALFIAMDRTTGYVAQKYALPYSFLSFAPILILLSVFWWRLNRLLRQ